MLSHLIVIVLAVSLAIVVPVDADMAQRRKPRFKIIERTYFSETFFSLPGLAVATRYPDTLEVNGPSDSKLIDVDLRLLEFSHGTPEDLDLLLVGPDGRTALVMSDAGGQAGVLGIDLVLDDDARTQLPRNAALKSGRYRPANYEGAAELARLEAHAQSAPGEDGVPGVPGVPGEPGGTGDPGGDGEPGGNDGPGDDQFPDPAPTSGDTASLSTFRGMDPTGSWQLFIRADGAGAGSLTGGWALEITVKKRR